MKVLFLDIRFNFTAKRPLKLSECITFLDLVRSDAAASFATCCKFLSSHLPRINLIWQMLLLDPIIDGYDGLRTYNSLQFFLKKN